MPSLVKVLTVQVRVTVWSSALDREKMTLTSKVLYDVWSTPYVGNLRTRQDNTPNVTCRHQDVWNKKIFLILEEIRLKARIASMNLVGRCAPSAELGLFSFLASQ